MKRAFSVSVSRQVWTGKVGPQRISRLRRTPLHNGSKRHGVRRESPPTPGYKLVRRYWPGLTREEAFCRLVDRANVSRLPVSQLQQRLADMDRVISRFERLKRWADRAGRVVRKAFGYE